MGKLFFKAELLDDIVLSLRTATAGDHKSLDYIPGSVFLGVAASRLYSTVSAKSAETAWELFHTSKVRFYNAYPLMNDKRAIPMPLSIHSEKVPRPGKEKEMLNFASSNSKLEENVQYRQNRSGYVFFENAENDKSILNVFSPSKTSRMRTAINAQTGTAEKAQLYGYESLNAGQVFVGIIEGDDSVSDIEAVKKLFSSGEIIHIGRSKTASYGRVKVSELKDYKETSISENALSGTSFSILAVSDLCLRNPLTGTPELTLSPSYLGLGEDWECDKERSFSRYSNVYQYNAYRKEIEIQKTLLSKGSIFTFKSNKPLSEDEKKKVLAALQNGIGDAKGQGFGEIALFNAGSVFTKEEVLKQEDTSSKELSPEEDKWLKWLKTKDSFGEINAIVGQAVKEFVEICKSIKKFHGFDDDEVFWPGNAQWGMIQSVARQCSTTAAIKEKIFTCETPVIKQKTEKLLNNGSIRVTDPDPEWNYEAALQDNGQNNTQKANTLRDWLINFIDNKGLDDKKIRIALQELSKRCKDLIADKDWLKNEEYTQNE